MWSDSICQVGISVVENGMITETKSWLVNPNSFFDDFNVRIHKITAEMVKDSPKFKELLTEIIHYFNDVDFVVAHNARFDVRALYWAIRKFDDADDTELDIGPTFDFACSMAMARRAYPKEPSYSLQSLCAKLGIDYGNHDAGADAKSCAELSIKIFQEKGVDMSMPINTDEDILFLEDKLQIFFGCLTDDGFANSVCKH